MEVEDKFKKNVEKNASFLNWFQTDSKRNLRETVNENDEYIYLYLEFLYICTQTIV